MDESKSFRVAQFLGYDIHEFREKLNEEISMLDLFSEITDEFRTQKFDSKEKIELISLLYLGIQAGSSDPRASTGSTSLSVGSRWLCQLIF